MFLLLPAVLQILVPLLSNQNWAKQTFCQCPFKYWRKKCQSASTDEGGELSWLLKTLYVACKKVESALREEEESVYIFPLWKCRVVKLNVMDAHASIVNFLI